MDIQGAFDNADFSSMERALTKRGANNMLIEWTMSMLRNRIVEADLGHSNIHVTTVKGCPQGGVMSPLL